MAEVAKVICGILLALALLALAVVLVISAAGYAFGFLVAFVCATGVIAALGGGCGLVSTLAGRLGAGIVSGGPKSWKRVAIGVFPLLSLGLAASAGVQTYGYLQEHPNSPFKLRVAAQKPVQRIFSEAANNGSAHGYVGGQYAGGVCGMLLLCHLSLGGLRRICDASSAQQVAVTPPAVATATPSPVIVHPMPCVADAITSEAESYLASLGINPPHRVLEVHELETTT
jgi:hypothetical protein